jgi:replication factor A1
VPNKCETEEYKEIPRDINDHQYTSIKSLTSFLFGWKVKARITVKHPLREWKNDKSSGKLLNIELLDNQGNQIQGTFFNEQAEKFDVQL